MKTEMSIFRYIIFNEYANLSIMCAQRAFRKNDQSR